MVRLVPLGQAHTIGPFLWTNIDLAIIVGGLVVLLILHLWVQYTTFGKSQRDIAGNVDLARASGINTNRVVALTWLLAGCVGAFDVQTASLLYLGVCLVVLVAVLLLVERIRRLPWRKPWPSNWRTPAFLSTRSTAGTP